MNFYQLLKLNQKIKSPTVKLVGLFGANILGFRHLSVRLDPVLACNLACKMCYFSNPEKRKALKGILSVDEMDNIAKVMFPRALQLFIGCGAEPTLNKNFIRLAELGKKYRVPDIGMITNGQLLTYEDLERLVEIGINEIAFSMHGTSKEVYEKFMVNSSFEKFVERLNWLDEIKAKKNAKFPQMRINFTVNSENFDDLQQFFEKFGHYNISTLQIRPVMDIGGEFSYSITDEQKNSYNQLIERFKIQAKEKKMRLLANTYDVEYKKSNSNSSIVEAVYCYISPRTASQLGIDWAKTSFSQFIKKDEWRSMMLRMIFGMKKSTESRSAKYELF